MKKKTHDEYVAELAVKNPNVEVVEQYVGANTKITHHCLIHDVYWKLTPTNALRGDGCLGCHKERLNKSRVKPHEEYVAELAIHNPTVEVVEKYINSKIKILHRCLIHNIEWKTSPEVALQGCGCPECHKEKLIYANRMTHEQYIKKLEEVNPNIEPIETYINAKTLILHRCRIHDIEWKTSPMSTLQGCGCIECGKEKLHNSKSRTHKQYVEELKKTHSNIVVIENYVNSYTPILHKCLIDDYEWRVTPGNILYGYGCPKCAGNIKRTQKEYIEELSKINPNIEVQEEYINANTPILHKCKIHNIQWFIMPSSALKGCGCIKCGKEKISEKNKRTHEEYVEELKNVNPNIICLEAYIDSNTTILHKCLIDGYEWKTIPSNILSGHGCPKCNESKGEKQIGLWLNKYNIRYEKEKRFSDCCDIKSLPFDFYLPDYNYCIEYDGEQHFKPKEHFGGEEKFKIQQKHDNIKNEFCKNNGISLLRISYKQNIEEELNNFLFI